MAQLVIGLGMIASAFFFGWATCIGTGICQ